MSGGHRQQRLELELGILLGLPCGGQLLRVGTAPGLSLELGLCRRQIQGLHSLYIHSFSIIGVQRP